MSYAKQTTVPVDRTRSEIERVLVHYKATRFMSGWSDDGAVVGFEIARRRVRFTLRMPKREEKRFACHPKTGRRNPEATQTKLYDQECRRRWRALLLVIKAKLEAVESGITTLEQEFLAHIILPSGETVASWLSPQLEGAYSGGKMPPLLPGHV